MAWLSRVNFISSDTLSFTDINNLGNDIRAWGDNVNGGGYTLSNVAISASSGTMGLVIGGTGTTSTLRLRSTSGVGTTGADIIFQAGNNGASEIMRLLNGGSVLINKASTDSPANKLDVQSTSVRFYSGGSTTDTNCHVGNSDVAGGQGGFITFHASAATPYLSINALSQGVAHRNISLAPSGGNVGIGASSPATKLHVLTANPGSANEVARFQGGTNNSNFRNYISCYTTNVGFWWELSNEDSAGTGSSNGFAFRERSAADPSVVRLYLASGGNVGIGTSSPAYQLQLSTDSAAKPSTNTWTIASDARLKTVRGDYEKGLTEICALRPVRYEYNGKGGFTADGKEQISILAQELMQVFPECVDTFKGKLEEYGPEIDLYNYNGHAITFALINAIKELKAKIDILEARN